MKRERQQKKSFPAVPVLAAAAVLTGVVLGVAALTGPKEPADVTAQGIAYLESLEARDPAAVDQVLRQRRLEELESQRAELLRQVKAGETDPFTLFQDAVILGDSRSVGFFYYGFVDDSRDLTGTGDTILDLPGKLDALEAMNPRYIYLCYGLNDLKIGHWASVDAHITDYIDRINRIRQRLPEAVVIVSSVLPYVDQSAGSDDPNAVKPANKLTEAEVRRLGNIPQWNAAMAEACREFGLIFVDNSAICDEHQNLWEPDGIHVKKSFYPYWGKNLVVAALEEGGIADEDPAA